MVCKNCGAHIQKTDAVCPYCGAMNAEGAERKFMGRLYHMKEELRLSGKMPAEAMKKTAGKSLWQMAAAMLGIVVVITAWNVLHWRLEGWQERKYEAELQDRLNWQDIHFEQMDQLYETGDLSGILEYLASTGEGIELYQVQSWEHAALLEAWQICEELHRVSEEYHSDVRGNQYELYQAVTEAFELGCYQTKERLERAADEEERLRLEACIQEARTFLTEEFAVSEAELEQKARELEEDGFLDYSGLRDFVEKLVGAEE